MIEVDLMDLCRIPDKEISNLLLAIPTNNARFEMFSKNSEQLTKALTATIDFSKVKVNIDEKDYEGVLKYRGALRKARGTHFGVELKVIICK